MALATDALFRSLPEDDFEPFEIALREALLQAVAKAQSLGIAGGRFPIHSWIDQRLGGELETTTDSRGQCEVASLTASSAPKASTVTPETFFNNLAEDNFAPPEEALRDSIFEFLARWKRQDLATMSHLRSDPKVKACCAAFLPITVTLDAWIDQRIGGEIELHKDASGSQTIYVTPEAKPVVLAKVQQLMMQPVPPPFGHPAGVAPPPPPPLGMKGQPPPPPGMKGKGKTGKDSAAPGKGGKTLSKEQWLQSLPGDELSEGEVNLRQALLDYLAALPQPKAFLGEIMQDSKVTKSRGALLPPNVSLRDWIDARVGAEFEMTVTRSGQVQVMMTSAAKAAGTNDWLESLPADEMTDEELELRSAILKVLKQHPSASLAMLSKNKAIATAQENLLPDGVSLQEWMDFRIGGEVDVSGSMVRIRSGAVQDEEERDQRKKGQQGEKGSKGAKGDKGSSKGAKGDKGAKGNTKNGVGDSSKEIADSFFKSLPTDSFTEAEENLRDAILGFMESWVEEDLPSLSKATLDQNVRRCKAEALPKGNSVSLKEWIERRLGGELEITRNEKGTLVIGIRGDVPEKRDAEWEPEDESASKSQRMK
eukprot:TRINITY_DN3022_c0_g1_i2.p1 TRINITY_DN3022_c0_g1~~TRINITY_DN3022_c0_g1_i2.p1  ORF type:complete len:595 (+),score=129.28 TRINITY_DN3022_c0_g1_i2:66-1850(+)